MKTTLNDITINSLQEKLNILFENYEKLVQVNEPDFLLENIDIVNEAGSRVGVRDAVSKVKRADKVASNKVDATFDRIVKDARTKIIGQTREEIMQNRMKVSTIIKKAILSGTAIFINPAIGILGTFISLALRKGLKERERNKILADLKGEIEIIEEKIRDADSNNDRDKKYQLMRLKRELQRSSERVKYGKLIKE